MILTTLNCCFKFAKNTNLNVKNLHYIFLKNYENEKKSLKNRVMIKTNYYTFKNLTRETFEINAKRFNTYYVNPKINQIRFH